MRISDRLAIGLTLASGLILTSVGCGKSEPTPSPSRTASSTKTGDDSGTAGNTSNSEATNTSDPSPPANDTPAETTWGNLRGRFVYDGERPERKMLNVTKDEAVCSKHHPLDDSLVVNKENGGLANVMISLYVKRGDSVPIHDSYATAAAVELDNLNCRFNPHVLVLRTSQSLVIKNTDIVGHNTNVDFSSNNPININTPPGESVEKRFSRAERKPARMSCSVHPWMSGWLHVSEGPYYAVTDASGNFEIVNLPAGELTFQVWHEKASINEVTIDGSQQEWKRGRFTFVVKPGENEFGEVKVSPSLFQ
jgi:hypothetical protein